MWPALTIGVVFTETPIYYRYTSQTPCTFLLFLSIHPLLENVPDLKFFALILAEKTLFFHDFPDWKVFKIFPDFPDW